MVKGTSFLNKKTQRVYATILTVLVSVAMIGSAFIGYFASSGNTPSGSANSTAANATADYQAKKVTIEAMVKQAKLDPANVALQTALANQYYDAGVAAETVAPTETQENFKNAVAAYQVVLKTSKDPNIMVDMATAAFKSQQNDLAEKTFKEALTLKPDHYNGLVNYGFFLANVKQDLAGAISQWEKAKTIAASSTEKDQVAALISQAQSQLKSNPAVNGTSSQNPNPALKNPTGK